MTRTSAELLDRVKALLRRYQIYRGKDTSDQPKERFLKGAGIQFNEDFNEMTVDGRAVELSTIEYNILLLMMRHPQKIFSAQNLYKSIWLRPARG